MALKKHSTTLVGHGGWHFAYFPSDLIGTRTRVRIKGKINGFPFAASAMPSKNGLHEIPVNAAMRQGAGLKAGDEVRLAFEIDTAPPPAIKLPADFARALRAAKAMKAFNNMAYSHRQEYVRAIEDAKKPETRARRIEKSVQMILDQTDPFHPKTKKTK